VTSFTTINCTKTSMKPTIATASRCIIDSKAVLMGYDAQDRELFGIGIRSKSVVRWAMQGVSKSDLKRLKKEYAEWQKENQ
jgi:hypothetical protein